MTQLVTGKHALAAHFRDLEKHYRMKAQALEQELRDIEHRRAAKRLGITNTVEEGEGY